MKFLDWFIEEQQEEEDNADKMITRMKLFGSDAKALYDLDQENAGPHLLRAEPACDVRRVVCSTPFGLGNVRALLGRGRFCVRRCFSMANMA